MSAYLALPRSPETSPEPLPASLLVFSHPPCHKVPSPTIVPFWPLAPAPHLVLMASLWVSASDLPAHLSAFPPHYPSEPAQLLDLSSEDTLLHTPLVQCPVALSTRVSSLDLPELSVLGCLPPSRT